MVELVARDKACEHPDNADQAAAEAAALANDKVQAAIDGLRDMKRLIAAMNERLVVGEIHQLEAA